MDFWEQQKENQSVKVEHPFSVDSAKRAGDFFWSRVGRDARKLQQVTIFGARGGNKLMYDLEEVSKSWIK